MIIETSSAFVAAISALSTIIKGINKTRELTDETVKLSESVASKRQPDNDSVQALAHTTIDGELIEIATENIKRVTDRLKRDLRDPSITQAAKDDAVAAANFAVCSELKRIKALNGNSLPGSDRFHELWASHNCAS
jgi:prophage DNA circulation protein